jgi:ABC-type transport system involved in cytochrome c biogenesis ATPase subunit
MTKAEALKNLEAADAAYKIAWEAHEVSRKAYHAQQMGDHEFVASQNAFKAALAAWEEAEFTYLAIEDEATEEVEEDMNLSLFA